MRDEQDLRQTLERIDGKGYRAYKDIRGRYAFGDWELIIDYVQGDPFASPSRIRVVVPQDVAGFPAELYGSRPREVALRDLLLRQFGQAARELSRDRGTGKSGLIACDRCGQEILERSGAQIDAERVELRFVVGLPAQGRRVKGRQAIYLLCEDVPALVERALLYRNLDAEVCERHVATAEDADWLRGQLDEAGLVAFVPNGAVLPRRSGVDPRPMSGEGVVPFCSPESLRVRFVRPNFGPIEGMGIPRGVTLIVGGGYHGKSTLMRALTAGVWEHVPGDGREFVVSDAHTVKIRAEDGRRVVGVDISSFISNLPGGRSTTSFSSDDASGSTSQAANIMEALEAGAEVLLMDEDTCATNFMIRDHRMQQLIVKEHEPITPFIDRVRQLFDDHGVSTILVIGGVGDYFEAADIVLGLRDYLPSDLTREAHQIARDHASGRAREDERPLERPRQRAPLPESIDPSRGRRDVKLRVRDVDEVSFGTEDIDLSAVEQIVDPSQLRAIAEAMVHAKREHVDGRRTLGEVLDAIERDLERHGLDALSGRDARGDLARFRRFELAAALNRLRSLEVR